MMLNKVSAVARMAGFLLAIVAGFMPGLGFNVALVLVVLGLIAGISMPSERFIPVGITLLVLPSVGAALGAIPAIGAQLGAVAGGLALFAAGALASAIVMVLVGRVKDDLASLGK